MLNEFVLKCTLSNFTQKPYHDIYTPNKFECAVRRIK
jgi:hypothetical protein